MIERVWRMVDGAHPADAAANHRSNNSPTVPARIRAKAASSTKATNCRWA
jgi:hypothetical protein